MLKNLLKDAFKHKGIYFLLIIGIIQQIGISSVPYFSKIYIDFIQNNQLGEEFYRYIYIGIFVAVCSIILGIYKDFLNKGVISDFEIKKSIYYYKKFFSLDYEYRNIEGTGKTISKINRGIEAQTTLINSFLNLIVVFLVRIVFIGGIIFSIYKPLVFVFIIIGILFAFLNKYISRKIKFHTDKEQEISENISRQTNKMIMESNLINISNKTEYEINYLKNIYKDIPGLRQKIYLNNNILYTSLHIIFQIMEILSYAILGILVVRGQMTMGELVMTVSYIWWMRWPVEIIMTNISEYRNQLSKYEALEKFINRENKIVDGKKHFVLGKGEIVFDKVSFWYNTNKKIFEDFNLKIEGGKTFALVGHSGSGKSTLIKLILRKYMLDGGNIFVDGQNIQEIKISTFYENIGYLSQDPSVFDGTIRQNLEYSINGGLEEDDLWEALKKVDLYELVKNSHDGLNTEVGEKGLKLSGGERQRLAIARIFLKDPQILILDEPTAALDSISESKITAIINQIMKDRTVIVIAHRLQTVIRADNIVVMEKGNIIEFGNHYELIKLGGVYSTLVDLQNGVVKE